MGGAIARFLQRTAQNALEKRPPVAWGALAVSLCCQAAAVFLFSALRVPPGFAAVLASSAALTVAMFAVRRRRLFLILLAPRAIVLGVLLFIGAGQRALDMVLTLPLLAEIAIAESFPGNLGLCAGAIAISAATGLLLLTGGTGPAATAVGFPHADWFVVSLLFALAAALMLHYREQALYLEQERRRLDAAIGELAKANLGYQEYATVLEQRTMLEERKRITREIHDIIGYTLTNNIMMMEAAVEMVRRDPARVSRLITEARRNAEEGLDGIRNALYLLRAQEDPRLAGMDLIARLVTNFHAATGVEVRLEYGNAKDSIDRAVEGVLFHVIQEALTNSFRHGRATLVEVLFWKRDDGTLVLNIRDNGGGAMDIHEGIGLTGMRERLVPLNGSLRLRMDAHGFTVTAEVPPRHAETAQAGAAAPGAIP